MSIQVKFDDVDFGIGKIRTYSGRYMYNKQCLALVGNIQDFATFVSEIAQEFMYDTENDYVVTDSQREFFLEIANVSVDSMGLDQVFYWENVELIGVPDNE